MTLHYLTALGIIIGTSSAADLMDSFLPLFPAMPAEVASKDNPLTAQKIDLGRQLFFDKRFSKNQDISCNSCHNLSKYGTDNAPTSTGHKDQKGSRNTPTVYHAALHIAQGWEGRAATVEDQAKAHLLNTKEMALANEEALLRLLNSIPGYVESFKNAFPEDTQPLSLNNFSKAIGAFERKLLSPSRWDAFLNGNKEALTAEEKKGFTDFIAVGCVNCHMGVGVGGHLYQKLGLAKPWPGLKDSGRMEVTKSTDDKHFFKVPSLRNISETGPYLHDGSVADLGQMVTMMAEHQLAKPLPNEQARSIISFLRALKGELPADFIKEPALPAAGPELPKPDPS
jgi:cytochrome c peroxidase